jgi:hypothetical protein
MATALLLLVGRFTFSGHGVSWPGTYEAFAHIWVGITITLSWVYRGTELGYLSLGLLVLLTTVETAVFFYGVHTGKFKLWKDQP